MKLKDLTLDKLKTMQSLRETGSISKSAQNLYVTPSAVSQCLSALEEQLGKQLFIRRGKTLLATSYCQKILQIYEPFAQNLGVFLEQEQNDTQIKGQLRVFIPGSVGPSILAEPFARFLDLYPQVSLAMDNGAAPRALQELHSNQFDFAICGIKKLISQHKWCSSHPLFHLTMNLYCSKSFYEKHKTAIRRKDFQSLHFITGVKSQFMLDWYFKDVMGRNFRSPSRLSIYDMNFSIKAVLKGLGVGLLVKELIHQELQSKELIEIGPKHLIHPLFLVHQKEKVFTPTEKAFKEFLLDYFTSLNLSH